MLGIHPQTIRTYEKLGFIKPARSRGNSRLFSDRDVALIERIQILTRDLGVNLAGVEIILRMRDQIEAMQQETSRLLTALRNEAPDPDAAWIRRIESVISECEHLESVDASDEEPLRESNHES